MSNITLEDKMLLFSRWIKYEVKIEILNDDETVLDEIVGLVDNGSLSINSSSYVRRSYNFSLIPTNKQSIEISENSRIWINKVAKVYIGILTPRLQDYIWYPCGEFVFTNTDSNYSADENILNVTCGDKMYMLDGTSNGEISALELTIPAYEKNSDGSLKYNIIKDVFISTLTQLGNVNRYIIEDIGEFYALEQNNQDFNTYRANNPLWNTVPYDLEFSIGDSVASILTSLIELYPNYDMCFDEDGIFTAGMIPSLKEYPITLSNDEIQNCLLSESISTELTGIRNITNIYGQTIEIDFYSETSVLSNNTYNVTIDNFAEEYSNRCVVAFLTDKNNPKDCKLKINNLDAIPIISSTETGTIEANTLNSLEVYAFEIKKLYENGAIIYKAYLLGQWQPHAIAVLTDGTVLDKNYTCSNGKTVKVYSEDYFKDKYNAKTIYMKVNPDSPFTVQKIGERVASKDSSDSNCAGIISDSLALEYAKYLLYQLSTLTDNVSISIDRILPWVKEYQKVSYVKKNTDELKEYITDSVSYNFNDGTTSITMHTFYPLYE